MKRPALLWVWGVLLACGDPSRSTASDRKVDDTSAAPSSPSAARGPKPPPARTDPEKITSPIRDNSARGESVDGATFEARLLVSKVTPTDGLHLAMRFRLDKPLEKDDPRRKATIDAASVLPSLTFEIDGPGGKTSLTTPDRVGEGQLSLVWFDLDYAIDGQGATRYGKTAKWARPAPALLATPGSYTLKIGGSLAFADRTVPVSLAPLPFEVAAEAASFKSLATLARDAEDLVRKEERLTDAPKSFYPVIDDADGLRWFRFQLDAGGVPGAGHDLTIVEVLLDPGGALRNYDRFPHNSCIAEGVAIDTPAGRVPVEQLRPGDAVVSFDPTTGRKTIATVEHVNAAHAERLIALGALRTTGSHPVFADGGFVAAAELHPGARVLGSDLAELRVDPSVLERPATVYELSVSAPNTYFAGGVLVHNKAVFVPVGGNEQPFHGLFYRRAARR